MCSLWVLDKKQSVHCFFISLLMHFSVCLILCSCYFKYKFKIHIYTLLLIKISFAASKVIFSYKKGHFLDRDILFYIFYSWCDKFGELLCRCVLFCYKIFENEMRFCSSTGKNCVWIARNTHTEPKCIHRMHCRFGGRKHLQNAYI